MVPTKGIVEKETAPETGRFLGIHAESSEMFSRDEWFGTLGAQVTQCQLQKPGAFILWPFYAELLVVKWLSSQERPDLPPI